MTEVRGRVALRIVGDGLTVVCGEQVAPDGVAIGVGLSVARGDVAVGIIGHRVDDRGRAVFGLLFGQQLSKRVIGVFRYTVCTVGDAGDAFFFVILIRDGAAAGEDDLADQLRGGGGLDLVGCLVLVCDLAGCISILPGDEIAADLDLIKGLAAEAVCFGAASDGAGVFGVFCRGGGHRKADGGIVVFVSFVVGGLRCAACREKDLL